MSELPKVAQRSKTKSLGTDGDIATPQHEQLVMALWKNLDAIASKSFCLDEGIIERQLNEIAQEERTVAHGYSLKFSKAIQAGQFQPLSTDFDADEDEPIVVLNRDEQGILKRAQAQLENYAGTLQLNFDRSLQQVTVTERTFQQVLEDHKGATVGFVDVSATVERPCNLFPSWDTVWEDHISAYTAMDRNWLLEAAKYGERVPPEILPEYHKMTVYFDVRTELPTISQLIREFKTLEQFEDFAKGSPFCVLVAMDIPEDVREIMQHEGFGCIALREWVGASADGKN